MSYYNKINHNSYLYPNIIYQIHVSFIYHPDLINVQPVEIMTRGSLSSCKKLNWLGIRSRNNMKYWGSYDFDRVSLTKWWSMMSDHKFETLICVQKYFSLLYVHVFIILNKSHCTSLFIIVHLILNHIFLPGSDRRVHHILAAFIGSYSPYIYHKHTETKKFIGNEAIQIYTINIVYIIPPPKLLQRT